MSSRALRDLILSAIHGSVVTGLAFSGCGNEDTPAKVDAGGSAGGESAANGGNGGNGGTGGNGGKPEPVSGREAGGVGAAHSGAGAMLPSNCFTDVVGVCCRRDVCFNPPTADADAGSSQDDAGTDAACPNRWPQAGFCTYYSELQSVEDGKCCYVETSGSCCGRPFLDGAHMLSAGPRPRTDWLSELVPAQLSLDDATREALARAWLRDARLEHASIASFARFTLQALALGAPADLIAAAQQAALDEVAHAQACYALASRYAGTALGPGELPMPSTLAISTLAEAAAAAVREGCVAETLAALQAAQQLVRATDPQVRAVLTRIAADEARHAELAFRFVRWALQVGAGDVRGAVSQAFADAPQQLSASMAAARVEDPRVVSWHEHGRLTAEEERACLLAGLRDVIAPCGWALLEAHAG